MLKIETWKFVKSYSASWIAECWKRIQKDLNKTTMILNSYGKAVKMLMTEENAWKEPRNTYDLLDPTILACFSHMIVMVNDKLPVTGVLNKCHGMKTKSRQIKAF